MKRKNTTRNALLTSVLALLLCVSMLVGTTFAWFTDGVVSGNNVIAAGNLDIDVMYANTPDGTYTSIENVADLFVAPIGATKGLWEPGHTEVAYLKVVNNGTLALKYQFMVDAANEVIGKSVLGNDIKLSEILKFAATEPLETVPAEYDRATAQAAAEASDGNLLGYTTETKTLAPGAAHYIALVVYMPETTGNEANYRGDAVPTINFKLTALATQVEAENDSFGDDYDENAWDKAMKVYSEQDLNAAIANGESAIMLGADVVLTDNTAVTIGAGKSIALNLNGYKISGNNIKDAGAVLVNNGTLSICGGEMTNNAANGGAVIDNQGTLTLDGVTVQGGAKDAGGYPEYAIVSYGDLTIENGTAVTSDRGAILLRGSGNTTINGGDFTVTDAFNGSVMTLHTITARDDSNLVIYGGNFENNYNGVSGASVICPWGGDITIYDGNFRDAMDDASNFNNTANFQNYMGAGSVVNVYGGTYDDTTVNKNVATGYHALKAGNLYHVVPENIDAVVSTDEELANALQAGSEEIILTAGEFTADIYSIDARDTLIITGQGADTKLNFKRGQVRLCQFKTLTIENCAIGRMVDKAWGQLVFGSSTEAGGVYTISNCIFDGEGTQGIFINQSIDATINIEKCTFNGDFGSEGAITIQNNNADFTVNVNDCEFNNIPETSHDIYVVPYQNGNWTLMVDGKATVATAK